MSTKKQNKENIDKYKVLIPMSNEKIKNITKSVVGASIVGAFLLAGIQTSDAAASEEVPLNVSSVEESKIEENTENLENPNEENSEEIKNVRDENLTDSKSEESIDNSKASNSLEVENKNQNNDPISTADENQRSAAEKPNMEASNEKTLDDFIDYDSLKNKANSSKSASDDVELSKDNAPEPVKADAPAAFEVKKPIPVGVADPKNLEDEEIDKIKNAVANANPDIKKDAINVSKDGTVTFTDPNGNEQTISAADVVIKDYSKDEKNIKDYNDSERYKETDLEPGSTNVDLVNTDEGVEKEGFKFELKNPSETSPSKTEYGYEITIDKKTGQRTYTKVIVTDSGLIKVNPGDKPMMGQGDKLTAESPDVTYKPEENTKIDGKKQRNLNYVAEEETLKHINNKDNDSTSFGFKDNYTQDNPRPQFFGSNFAITYKVNPWPNENDKLELMKLNGEYNEKVFVQGQDIDTGVKVDNMDASARERLVGQVYNPITGAVVPGARAYIGDDGSIHIQMPEGALKKNADGKYVVNKESIFNTKDYKALQNLDVKFFARPRTADEFKTIAETPDENGETGTYVETGAGTGTINHKGTDVTIDKQGIDRYDHYNLIGKLKINLDDTRYYNQRFEDGNNEDTSTITSSAVKPGEDFKVKIVQPNDPTETDKSALDMNKAESKGEAAGNINLDFINKANEGKAEKDKWKVDVNPNDISSFTVTPPKSAKAGDFVAIPVEYTYTNGSKDVHWFHFVVQESDNNKPEYHAEVGYKGDTLTQSPEIPSDDASKKKNQPKSYELVMPEDGSKYKDSAGNIWTDIKVDSETGEVTATVPEDADIKGGENLFVDVKVNYIDEKTGEAKEEIVKAQFIARPKYKEEVSKTFNSKIPFETKVIYDDTLEIGKVVKTEGRVGETETTFKQVVINGEKGIIDENGNFVKDKEAVETKTITEKVDAEIRIGTKPAKTTVTIPADTDYETSDSLEKGTIQLDKAGEDGEVTITTSRDPETGEITTSKVVTKEAKNKKMLIGTKTTNTIVHEEKIPFEYEVTFDPSLKPGEKVVDQEGKPGSKTTTYNIVNSKIVGDPIVKETAPIKAIIRVGDQKFTGETSHEVTEETKYITIVEEDPNLPVGETKEVQKGKRGSKTTKYTQKFENGVPGEVKEEVVSETPAVNRIIKVGTKTVTEHISKEITEEIPYGVKIEYDDTMPAGKTKVKTPGQAGSKTTEYYRNLINGKFDGDLNTREVTDKYKAPVDEVIVVGTKVAENNKDYNNDVDVEIEYVKDDSKYVGYVEKGELTKGKVETKIVNKFDPETGKIITTEEEVVTPAKQKIIVGTKDFTGEFSHKIEKTLPFETEIQYDDTMDAGTKEVTQKGVTGNAEQTVTQKYTNGVLADKEYTDEVTTKEPVKEIVKIGTKPVEKKVEIPFNTEYIYDNTIDAGTVVEDKDHPGKAGSVTVKTYFDKESGKFVSVEDADSKVAPVNKIVRVGTKPNDNMCPVPDKPVNPDNPDKPVNPDNPDKPVNPNNPDKPVNPDKPDNPSNPDKENPEKPGTPEDKTQKPNQPDNPTPSDPNQPGESENPNQVEKPDTSEKPNKAEEPGTAEKPSIPENPSDGKIIIPKVEKKKATNIKTPKDLPKTGDGLNASFYTRALSLMGSAMIAFGAKKKKKNDLDEK